MNNTLASADDAELVRRALDGERPAVGEIYDRYANHIYSFCRSRLRNEVDAADAMQDTFVRASTRLDQLRDPSRLRSWLFAIARNQIIVSGRSSALAIGGDGMELLAADEDEVDIDLLRVEAASQLWDASEGLSDRDQEVLELHVRHGLTGSELADALGVTESHGYVLLSRVRDRIASSLGGLLVARLGRDDCRELDQMLAPWDGRFTIDIRSRVTRHIRSCETCEQTHTTALASGVSFGVVPLLSVPPALRVDTLTKMVSALDKAGATIAGSDGAANAVSVDASWDWKPDGFPTTLERTSRRGALLLKVAASVAMIMVLVGAGGWVWSQQGSTDEIAMVDAPAVEVLAATSTTEPETTATTDPLPTSSTTEEPERATSTTATIEQENEPEPDAEPLPIEPIDPVTETTEPEETEEQEEEEQEQEEEDEQDRGDEQDEEEEDADDEEPDGNNNGDDDTNDGDDDPEDPIEPVNQPPVIVSVVPRTDTVQAMRAGACEGESLTVGVETFDPDGEVVTAVLEWQSTVDTTTTTALAFRQRPIWFGAIGPWIAPGAETVRVVVTDDGGATAEATFEVQVAACPFGFSG